MIYYDDDVVVLEDAYPKATVHWLVMPRKLAITTKHPFDAFQDQQVYERVRETVDKFLDKAAAEIGAKYKGSGDPADLVKAGVHAVPSLENVHVHIISKDMHSPRLKNAKHYLTFNSRFFVDFDEIRSIPPDDDRRDPIKMEALLKRDLSCIWCGASFGRSFAQLKRHLDTEYRTRFR